MKGFVNKIILPLLLVVLTTATAHSEEALMTIKFAKQNVAYQDQLFNAVREAVATKPTVVFDVVSYGKGNNGKNVADDIARIGVNPLQITYRAKPAVKGQKTQVVKIFVR